MYLSNQPNTGHVFVKHELEIEANVFLYTQQRQQQHQQQQLTNLTFA